MAQPKQETVKVVRVRPRKSLDKNQNIAFTPGKVVEISALMAKNRKLLDQEGYILLSEYEAGNHVQTAPTNDAEAQIAALQAKIAAMEASQPKAEPLPNTPHVAEAETTETSAPAKPKATRGRKPATRKTKAT